MYINQKWIQKWNEDSILLEIKLPREIMKSPLATEVALTAFLQNSGVSTWWHRNIRGQLPAYSSLEIASMEGVVHFYIWANKKFRALIESNFYSQYPGIEIVEAEDYTKAIRYHHLSDDVLSFSSTYKMTRSWIPTNPKENKPYKDPKTGKDYTMPADFVPIKTYVDLGLDKDPKEEFKTDQLTPLLEAMGSIGKGEYYWYQVIVQDEAVYNGASKMPKFYVNKATHEHLSLKDMAELRKKQIRTASYKKKGDLVYDDYGAVKQQSGKDKDGNDIKVDITYQFEEPKAITRREVDLTLEEKEEIELINTKISKPILLSLIRIVYVAKSENFKGTQVPNILAFPRPFIGKNNISGLLPSDNYDYPWEDIGKKRLFWRTEEIFDEYVEREAFFPHIPSRESLDKWEDFIFFPYPAKVRKVFRMIYEVLFYPFDHPQPSRVMALNLEEVATLWHLPGQVAGTPTIPRIDSNKGVAPTNLPV